MNTVFFFVYLTTRMVVFCMLDVDRLGTVLIECLFFKLCNQRDSCFVADILFFLTERAKNTDIFLC